MKPFNLMAALAGEPVVTRDGRPVKVAGFNLDAATNIERLIGWANGEVRAWDEEGRYMNLGRTDLDLFMAPKKRTVWVNLYGGRYPGDSEAAWHPTAADADCHARPTRIGGKAWPLEIEE